jgi:hypothetical protein
LFRQKLVRCGESRWNQRKSASSGTNVFKVSISIFEGRCFSPGLIVANSSNAHCSLNHGTEQLAFTSCVFKDCNIDQLEADEERGLYARDNMFDRPLEERGAEFEKRLAEALAARKRTAK